MEPVTVALVDALAPADPRLRLVGTGDGPQVAVVAARAVLTIERLAGAGIAVLAVAGPDDHDGVLEAVRAGATGCVTGRVGVAAVLRTAAGEAVFSPGLAELVLDAFSRPGGAAALLTPREADVLALVVEGLTGRQIAARLVLSPRTVENHVQRLLRKLGVPNRAALVRYAIEHDLV